MPNHNAQKILLFAQYLASAPDSCPVAGHWKKIVDPFLHEIKGSAFENTTVEELFDTWSSLSQEPPIRFGVRSKKLNWRREKLKFWLHKNKIMPMPKADAELFAAVLFLKRHGLFNEYERLRARIGFNHAMPLARHVYYLSLLKKYLSQARMRGTGLNILEIGAGSGGFARMCHEYGMMSEYHIVDLPQILLSSSITITQSVKDARLTFHQTESEEQPSSFHFYPNHNLKAVPRNYFDIVLNFNSFMEMTQSARNEYLTEIPFLLKRPGLFMNVNRRQKEMLQEDGSMYDNNPLLYPYQGSGHVLEWGVDQMQETIKTNSKKGMFVPSSESFAIIRAEVFR